MPVYYHTLIGFDFISAKLFCPSPAISLGNVLGVHIKKAQKLYT